MEYLPIAGYPRNIVLPSLLASPSLSSECGYQSAHSVQTRHVAQPNTKLYPRACIQINQWLKNEHVGPLDGRVFVLDSSRYTDGMARVDGLAPGSYSRGDKVFIMKLVIFFCASYGVPSERTSGIHDSPRTNFASHQRRTTTNSERQHHV